MASVSHGAVLLGRYEPHSPQWYEMRSSGLGGSEVATILGVAPRRWGSRYRLFHEKSGNLQPDLSMSEAQEWGIRAEPMIRAKYLDNHALPEDWGTDPELTRQGWSTAGTWHKRGVRWAMANPDLLIYSNPFQDELVDLAEFKTSRFDDGWGRHGSDLIPPYYRAQILWYCIVFGLDSVALAVLIAGSDYREYRIKPFPGELADILAAAAQFWDDVEAGFEPEMDDSPGTYAAATNMNPDRTDKKVVELPPSVGQRYVDACRAVKAADAENTYARSLVARAMGDAQYGLLDGEKVASRARSGGSAVPTIRMAKPLSDKLAHETGDE